MTGRSAADNRAAGVAGKVCVVTGAGSGIGRALALELAKRGARLALSDVVLDGVSETAERARALGAQVHVAQLDVADRAAVTAYAVVVADLHGAVHQLYNNAGVAGGSTVLESAVLDSAWADFERVLSINLFGVIYGTRAFLPHLVASGDGHVVNISSLNGFMAQDGLSAYSASKFGVRGFTEALRVEMLAAGHPVRVTVVHPGGVHTQIATAALERARASGHRVTAADEAQVRRYQEKLLRMAPEQAARIVVDGVVAGRSRILVGRDAKIIDAVVRLVPSHYPAIVARLARHASR
ncbi:Short-chain dehydrogenase [Quadrisphaera granulorum]|uniref:Short-subunit dehydrogenase n=1 Tax=Quadrisphaera granulorum TaxID=317664 RepID=A0A315ZPP7_9ACTN|nr:SDR family oxidoreductase [Quadrisphaera granulorum]PWJ47496.1 short-subunit dehydrogenase [Quadrisphaera granulorum]SZE98797.1 Short-chain dehydrogenase [Quadrisphaera granulorum]